MSKSSIEGQGASGITGQLQGPEINQFAPAPNAVGFRLLKLTNLLSQPFFKQIHKQHAISLNEWRAMVVLANKPGSAAQDIAESTGLIAMNVSRAVAELRKAGRVSSSRDPENHRRTLLWLTPAGEKLYAEVAPYSAMKAQEFYGSLGLEELEAFSQQLDRLIKRAEEMLDDDAD